ncbi:MAG: glycerol kinase GlpK [Gammaproteobacteria bacterium]|nr:glycerol kinase GlpK [Gammaproteobacteria bacterium]
MNLLSIDQGTTGTTVILFDDQGDIKARAYREIRQHYPQPGWVEHDPYNIWDSVVSGIEEVMDSTSGSVAAIGITNQRETTILWDRVTGQPYHNAIVWQCRRTSNICADLKGSANFVKERTGLPLDAYFSATKIRWLLDNVKVDIERALVGTVDAWLLWKLTGGAIHATDHTNASRTLLYNLETGSWDPELLEIFNIPGCILPSIYNSIYEYGSVSTIPAVNGVPILAIAGDQQASLFGNGCLAEGSVKNTYGTGCFLMMNTGKKRITSDHGLITTVAVSQTGERCFALEGSIFSAGSVIQWLRDGMQLIGDASDSEAMARAVSSNEGVYIVPAFTGLGAPYWDMNCRAAIVGLSFGTDKRYIVRAALESVVYQSVDVLRIMEIDSGLPISGIKVDGGMTKNEFVLQFQADMLDTEVHRPRHIESTAFGIGFMAGLGAGVWLSIDELSSIQKLDKTFVPRISENDRSKLLAGWHDAVNKARHMPQDIIREGMTGF